MSEYQRRPDSDANYWQNIHPVLKEQTAAAGDEICYRLDQMKKIPDVTSRRAFRESSSQIEELVHASNLSETNKGEIIDRLTDIVAKDQDGPIPFLARVAATEAVGEVASRYGISANQAQRLKEAIATEPFPRGSIIHSAVLTKATRTSFSKRPRGALPTDFIPDKLDEDGLNRFRREAMVEIAVDYFSRLGPQAFEMELPAWAVFTQDNFERVDWESEGPMVPDRLVRLHELAENSEAGIARKGHIPSFRSQAIAAVVGVPNQKYREGIFEQRNLSGIRAANDDNDSGPATISGIRIDPLIPLTPETAEKVNQSLNDAGYLPFRLSLELLEPAALDLILALRVIRGLERMDLGPVEEAQNARALVNREVRRLNQPLVVEKVSAGKSIGEEVTTILDSHVDEYNHHRGAWEKRPKLTVEETIDLLTTSVTALILDCNETLGPVVIDEDLLLKRFNRLVDLKGLSKEDIEEHPGLLKDGTIRNETIRRKSIPTERGGVAVNYLGRKKKD